MVGAACSRKVVLVKATRACLAVLNGITLIHLMKTSGSPQRCSTPVKVYFNPA